MNKTIVVEDSETLLEPLEMDGIRHGVISEVILEANVGSPCIFGFICQIMAMLFGGKKIFAHLDSKMQFY